MPSEKTSVYVRRKRLSNGKTSLYLDIYCDGKRSYEFLRLYLVPETNRKSKSENKETLRAAEAARARKIVELESRAMPGKKEDITITDYMEKWILSKNKSTGGTYRSVLRVIRMYFGDKFILGSITESDVSGFCAFMSTFDNGNKPGTTISKTTQHLYCSVLKILLNAACDDGIVGHDIVKRMKIVKKDESERQYLTIDELRTLASTKLNCAYRKAFMFSCLTGMRKSDVRNLTWSNVHDYENGTKIMFRQKKTSSVEYLNITVQAREIMGERGNPDDRVFKVTWYDEKMNKSIQKWVSSAGIKKKITFHCARHTFAVMMLTLGVDIYTVSKLLGHKELSTTQIYAKIVDEKKQEAVNRIPSIM